MAKMLNDRLALHELLCEKLGSRNVYFQPPESIKMKYPAIVYSRNRIENTSAEDVSMPKVAAILFASNGDPLACMMTYGDELAPGEKQGVKASALSYPPDISATDVASYEIYAYPEQFQFDW